MPYHVGAKNSGGCKNSYPVIKTSTGEVIACHATRASAEDQIIAIGINENKADGGITPTQTSSTDAIYPGVGIKRPSQGRAGKPTGSSVKSKYGKKPKKPNKGTHADANYGSGGAISAGGTSMGTKADNADFWAGTAFEKN